MDWFHNFTQAIIIMVLGMSVTFIFITVLIIIIQINSKIIAKYVREPEPSLQPIKTLHQNKDDSSIVAAITIAVKKYHQDKKSKKLRR